jgi:hypothetical protein
MAKKIKAEKVSGREPKFATATGKEFAKPGQVIKRIYNGKEVRVEVKADGYHFNAQVYTSLSKLASELTDNSTNGLLFFHLGKYEIKEKPAKVKKEKKEKKAAPAETAKDAVPA